MLFLLIFFWQCFELQYANDETLMMLFLFLMFFLFFFAIAVVLMLLLHTRTRVCDVVSRACMLTLAGFFYIHYYY